jgi:hypothetical protein
MPKRVIDGDALWTSNKLADVRREYQAEYPYLLPLALGNGTFECDPRLIWRTCYCYGRAHVTTEIVAAILDEFVRVKLLFRWQGDDGKTYGYWIGIDKTGRLPPPSRSPHERRGPEVPADRLAAFLAEPNGQPMANQRSGDGALGLGIGSGLGLGSDSASGGGSLLHSSLRPSGEDRSGGARGRAPAEKSETGRESIPQNPNAGGKPPSSPKVPAGRATSPSATKAKQGQPAVKRNPAAPAEVGVRRVDFGPKQTKQPAAPHQAASPVPAEVVVSVAAEPQDDDPAYFSKKFSREMHPPRVTDGNFDAMDFAFTLEEDFAGLSPKEVRRVVYYCFRASAKKKAYWTSKKANIDSPARLEQALAQMVVQVPEDFYLSGSILQPVPIADLNCTKCGGSGAITVDHPAYPGAPGLFQASETCECVRPHPAPWRIDFNNGLAA